MDIEEFIEFRKVYSQVNEYEIDILKHFYLKYNLPIATTFEELVDYFELNYIDILEITVIRDDIEDFKRIVDSDNKLGSEQVDNLLNVSKSSNMMRVILDNAGGYSLYVPILKSFDLDLIKYLLDKMEENDVGLDSEYESIIAFCKSISEDTNIDEYESVIDFLCGYYDDWYNDIIVGFVEGYKENNELCKEYARKYILGDYPYDVQLVFEGLDYDSNKIKSELEELNGVIMRNNQGIITGYVHTGELKHYLIKKFGLE